MACERSRPSTTLPSRKNVTSGSTRSASLGLCSMTLNGPRTPPKTLTTSSTTAWCSSATSALPLTGVILGMISSRVKSNPGIGLAPAVEIDDLGERATANRTETAHRIADRQDGVRMEAGRDAHRFVALLRVTDMPGRQGRAEPDRARRQ